MGPGGGNHTDYYLSARNSPGELRKKVRGLDQGEN